MKDFQNKSKTYGNRCGYCDAELDETNFTVDHIVPMGRGGPDVRYNKIAACRRCNELKGRMLNDEFRPIFMQVTGRLSFAFETRRQVVLKSFKQERQAT